MSYLKFFLRFSGQKSLKNHHFPSVNQARKSISHPFLVNVVVSCYDVVFPFKQCWKHDIYECYCQARRDFMLFKGTISVSGVTYFKQYDNMAAISGYKLFEKKMAACF